jgi:osmotically-inducible protein OsmY
MSIAAALGAVAAYLLDPDRGRRRRVVLRDRARAAARREVRVVERRASYRRGRVIGWAKRLRHRRSGPPADDRVLVDRIRSELRGITAGRPHLTIDAVDGIVTLRGQVEPDLARDAELRIRGVAGVRGVVNLLHDARHPAPNKADALRSDGQQR